MSRRVAVIGASLRADACRQPAAASAGKRFAPSRMIETGQGLLVRSVRRGAFLAVGVRVIVEHLLDDLGLELAVGALRGFHEVEILDREAVRAELEVAAER